MPEKHLPRFGDPDAASISLEEFDLQDVLKFPYRFRHGRLANVQTVCGLHDAPLPGDLHECLKVAVLDARSDQIITPELRIWPQNLILPNHLSDAIKSTEELIMKFLRIGDVVISHDIVGADSGKPAIAFINSLGTDQRIWSQVVEALSDEFTLLTFDKRGHGLSDLASPPYQIENFADDLIALIEHYGLRNVTLCGLSIGGLIALSTYDKRPDLIRGLFFADTAHKIGTPEFWAARIGAVESGGIGSILEPIMSRWFTGPYRTNGNADYRGYCNMLLRQPVEGYAGACAAIRDADFTDVAKRIAVPAHCVAGAEDGSTPPELVRSLADLIPGCGFEIIEGAAHIPCVETPELFTGILRRFLSAL